VISDAELAHWRQVVPWTEANQVEQDLVLSRLIIEIASHPVLREELVFRGGTCFHKLWLDRPWRYSEDLDYVRRTGGGIGKVFDALREVAHSVGFDDVQTQLGRHPKVRLRSTFASGDRMRVKIEMNTFERSPARPAVTRPLSVDSAWFTGAADVLTFTIEELTATKVRALFQRSKGRDLFDLWLAVERAGVPPGEIADCFGPYRPDRWTATRALQNLDAKLADVSFTTDLEQLASWPDDYQLGTARLAVERVIEAIVRRER